MTTDSHRAPVPGASTVTVNAEDSTSVTIPGGGFLLDAEFHRAGPDLVLVGEGGRQVVVTSYFAQATPPALTTASGAVVTPDLAAKLAGPVAPGQFAQAAGAQHLIVVGKVDKLTGTVEVIHPDGTRGTLHAGDVIYKGDVVSTRADGTVGITFADSSTFALGKAGRMVIDELVYDPGAQEGQSALSVVKGTFSFVSGQIAKTAPNGTTIKTPVMTIGVRGTSIAGTADSEGSENSISLLQDPDGTVGQVSVTNAGGTVVLNQSNMTVKVLSFIQPPSQPVYYTPQQIRDAYQPVLDAHNAPPQPSNAPPPSGVPQGGPPGTGGSNAPADGPSNNTGGGDKGNNGGGDNRGSGNNGGGGDGGIKFVERPVDVVKPEVTKVEVKIGNNEGGTGTGGGNTGSGRNEGNTGNTGNDRNDEQLGKGDNGGNGQSEPSESGRAIDGYVRGALVFRDLDNDGVHDADEASTTSAADGSYTLKGSGGVIVVQGGIDTTTGQAVPFTMKAPAGSTVVTPLTTLVVAVAATGMSNAAAEAAVKAMLGLSGVSSSLANLDPIAGIGTADGKAVLAATANTVATINAAAKALNVLSGGTSVSAADIITTLVSKAASGTAVSLDDSTSLGALLQAVASSKGLTGLDTAKLDAIASALAVSNHAVAHAISTASSFADVSAHIGNSVAPNGALTTLIGNLGSGSWNLHDGDVVRDNFDAIKAAGITTLTLTSGTLTMSASQAAGMTINLDGGVAKVLDTGTAMSQYIAQIAPNLSEYHVTSGTLAVTPSLLEAIVDRLHKDNGSTVTLIASGDVSGAGWLSYVDFITVPADATATLDGMTIHNLRDNITVQPGGHLVAKLYSDDYVGKDLSAADHLELGMEAFATIDLATLQHFAGNIEKFRYSSLTVKLENGANTTAIDLSDVDSLKVAEGATITLTLAQWDQLQGFGRIVTEGEGSPATINIHIDENIDLRDDPHYGIANHPSIGVVTIAAGKTVDVSLADLNIVGFPANHAGIVRVHLDGDVREENLSLADRFTMDPGAKVTVNAETLLEWVKAGRVTIDPNAYVVVVGDVTEFEPAFLNTYVDLVQSGNENNFSARDGSNWFTAFNWSKGLPTNDSYAVISGENQQARLADGSAAVADLQVLGGARLIVGGGLTANTGSVGAHSLLELAGGELTASETFTINGTLEARMFGKLGGTFTIGNGGTLRVLGETVLHLKDQTEITVAPGGSFVNGGRLEIGGMHDADPSHIGSVTVHGTISQGTNAKMVLDVVQDQADQFRWDSLHFADVDGENRPTTDLSGKILLNVAPDSHMNQQMTLITGVKSLGTATFGVTTDSDPDALVGFRLNTGSHAVVAKVNSDSHTYTGADGKDFVFGATAHSNTVDAIGTGDLVHGGDMDDSVTVTSLDFAELQGGEGYDTLVLGWDLDPASPIDFRGLSAGKIGGFEYLTALPGEKSGQIHLDAAAVQNIADDNHLTILTELGTVIALNGFTSSASYSNYAIYSSNDGNGGTTTVEVDWLTALNSVVTNPDTHTYDLNTGAGATAAISLHGTGNSETFQNIGSNDIVHGGDGNDTFTVNALDFHRIAGGTGDDKVVFNTGSAVDLRSILGSQLNGIESFGFANGTVDFTLNAATVGNLTGAEKCMTIVGNSGTVRLDDAGWDNGVSGSGYTIYTHSDGTVLEVQNGITVDRPA